MKNRQETKQAISFILNDNLSVVMIDALKMSSRTDGLNYIQLGSVTPDGVKEQFRMMIPKANLEKIISALCTGSGYYPVKKTDKTKLEKREISEEKK
ncbi:hypothetical protein D4S03_06405 [bacterium]|nr:MAG: hypothetical protein D4S03_06405 [bacterium]